MTSNGICDQPSGKTGAQLSCGQLRAALQAALTDAEQRSLRAGDGAFCVNAFNRAVLLRLWDPGQDASGAVDETACRALAAEVAAYLREYYPENPGAHKGIVLACLARTFLEQQPMHPQAAARWRETADGYVCPQHGGAETLCRFCVCGEVGEP